MFSTKNYSKNNKCNDSIVCTHIDGTLVFGAILKFESKDNSIDIEIEKYDVTKISDNFYFYSVTNVIVKHTMDDNLKKCQSFSVNHLKYLSIIDFYLIVD